MIKSILYNLYKIIYFSFFNITKIYLLVIFKISRVYISGYHFTLVGKKWVIKIVNPKREALLSKEILKYKFLQLNNTIEEKEKFMIANNKQAYIANDILYIEKINATMLSSFLEDQERFLHYFEASIVKLLKLNEDVGFYHGDFHMDNILVSTSTIYFIDFDYQYTNYIENLKIEADILKFIFFFQKYHKNHYRLYQDELKMIVLKYFNYQQLNHAKIKMKYYLKDELNGFFN
jgi:tRNA A-37 threonylcarbamoyl transferase component Bud32